MAKKKTRKSTAKTGTTGGGFKPIYGVIALALVVVVGLIVILQMPPAGDAPVAIASNDLPREVTVAQATTLRDEGVFILDVREPSEWNEFHIPDATLIPLGQLASRLSEVPTDQPIVVICRSGNRSAQGRDILLNAGYTNVTSVAGGMNEWRAAGNPTVSGP